MAKTLVIYYSRKGMNYVNGNIIDLPVGNTARAAEMIRKTAGADLFEIETVRSYSKDYRTCTEEAMTELRSNARPALKKQLRDIAAYDKIVIAGPCWWGTYPMAVFTQLDALDFTGRTVYPLLTHEGSGLGHAAEDLRKHCPGAVIGEGLAIHGAEIAASEKKIAVWAARNLR